MATSSCEGNVAATVHDSSVVQAIISQCGQFATLPTLATKIIDAADDPSSTWDALHRIISLDPAFCARLLKLVNSPYYGVARPIGTLQEALELLGFRAVKNVAISTTLTKLFRGGRVTASWDAKNLWTHSIAVATAAQMLSRSTELLPDEAFLAGLVHDLGIIVEFQAQGPSFASMLDRLEREEELRFRSAERLTFNTTHEELGLAVCKAWRFPSNICLTTGFHHRPWELALPERSMPALIHVADILAARQSLGYARTVEAVELNPEILRLAHLSEDDVLSVEQGLYAAVSECCRILSCT